MERIELSRQADLSLLLNSRFGVGLYGGSVLQWFESIPAQISLSVPRSHWIEHVLPSIGYRKYFIVEIPQGLPELKEAWSYVEAADKSYSSWDIKGVFAHCREVGTLLDARIKSRYGDDSFLYTQRWVRSHSHFASLGLHEEDLKQAQNYSSKEVIANRAEAEHLILVTKALIKYAGQLLQT